MHELVTDHVIRVGERPAEWQDDAAAERLGDAARALAQLAGNGVGLLEVGMRCVKDERLPAAQLMREQPLQAGVPPFRHTGGDVNPFTFFRVEVDVEMLGFQHLKVELLVLDFIAAEVLRRGRRGRRRGNEDRERGDDVSHSCWGHSVEAQCKPRACVRAGKNE